MLQENPLRAKYFHQTPDPESASSLDPYTVFLRLLQRQEWVAQEKAAKLLTAIIDSRPMKSLAFNNGILSSDPSSALQLASFGGPDPAEAHISSFVDWLIGQMKRPSAVNKSVPISISILAVLLRERGTRQLFLRAGGVQLLPSMIKSSNSPANSQLLYELCLCAWQMTFLAAGADALGKAGIVRPLVEVTRVAQKEKVFRIAMSALRNLLDRPELHDTLAPEMVDAGLQKIVITKQMQAWGDDDIVELLKYMDEQLKHGIKVLSNFDKYKREVASGQLDWSPMHTSEAFWKEHADKFEERDFMVLRALLKLLESSREVKTLAVACSDVGMFIVHHPQGRYIVNDLRGKELVMRLMAHPDPDVQKQALLTVQKIMITRDKLEFLTGSSS
ncbi:v-type proton ATPase subunit H, partial [Haematococcus lacustris]